MQHRPDDNRPSEDDSKPDGYSFDESWESAFVTHIGPCLSKTVDRPDGSTEQWVAVRVDDRHINTWQYCHGSALAAFAEIATSAAAYIPGGSPVVIVDLSMQFIAAPKLGDFIEICAWTTRRTRSLVFVQTRAEVKGNTVFTASAIHKVIGA